MNAALSGSLGPSAFADAIKEAQENMLKSKINAISIKGGGSVRVKGGGGKFIVSREAKPEQIEGLKINEPTSKSTYTRNEQKIYIDSPLILIDAPSGGSTTWHYPTLGGSSLFATTRPYVSLASGVKIYIKFTATVATADFLDEGSAPPTTTPVQNSLTISAYTIESGNLSYQPASSGVTASTFTTGANTIYMLIARVAADGSDSPLTVGEWTTEYASNPMYFSFNDFNWFRQQYLIM